MVIGASASPDFTFETTIAATGSALLIAFAALRWGSTSSPGDPPRRRLLRRMELLVMAISLTTIGFVIYTSLDALATSKALSRDDRDFCVRLLGVSVMAFAAAALVDRVSSYSRAESAPWDFLHETRTFRALAASYSLFYCSLLGLAVSTARGLQEVMVGLASVAIGGLVIWQTMEWSNDWWDSRRRRKFFADLHHRGLEPVLLRRSGSAAPPLHGFADPSRAFGAVHLPTHEVKRLVALHEHERLRDPHLLCVRVYMGPVSHRLMIRDEGDGERIARTPAPASGLVAIRFPLWTDWLRLELDRNSK